LAWKDDQSLLSYMWPLVVFHYLIFQFPHMEGEIPTQIFMYHAKRGKKKKSTRGKLAVVWSCVR